MAWGKNGSDTLTSSGDDITGGTAGTSYKFNMLISNTFATGGDIFPRGRCGTTTIDSGSNYSRRKSVNGTESTDVNQTYYNDFAGDSNVLTTPHFAIGYFCNISGEEKLVIVFGIGQNTAGNNAPTRREGVGKWVTTSGQADVFGVWNSQGGSFDTDSNFTALGTD